MRMRPTSSDTKQALAREVAIRDVGMPVLSRDGGILLSTGLRLPEGITGPASGSEAFLQTGCHDRLGLVVLCGFQAGIEAVLDSEAVRQSHAGEQGLLGGCWR